MFSVRSVSLSSFGNLVKIEAMEVHYYIRYTTIFFIIFVILLFLLLTTALVLVARDNNSLERVGTN